MFSTEQHWQFFSEFCRYEKASGGPDPQLSLVEGMSRDVSWGELVWRAGCYISVYNVAFAEVIWREWPLERIQGPDSRGLHSWLEANFPRIKTRVERRCVRRPDWMLEFLLGYLKFTEDLPDLVLDLEDRSPRESYLELWEASQEVPRLGRYVALKLLEFLGRYAELSLSAPDIRPRGGWSPRSTLATLWEDETLRRKSDRSGVLDQVNMRVTQTQARLRDDYGLDIGLFDLQVLLCEYRESWEGRRQYPGRSLDSELRYALLAEELWGERSSIWGARRELSPEVHLGEIGGWQGPREGPARVLADYGYTWSDLLYDYQGTADYLRPSTRAGVPAPRVSLASIVAAQRPRIRVYEVLPNQIYQSSRWTVLTAEQGRDLASYYGITGIVNLWKDDPALHRMVEWYRCFPLADGRRVPVHALPQIIDEVVKYIEGGGCVLTMCYGGKNRSGLVSALLVHRLSGCTGREALHKIKDVRQGALVNMNFCSYLESLEAGADLSRGLLF